jgi:hypothetical protein
MEMGNGPVCRPERNDVFIIKMDDMEMPPQNNIPGATREKFRNIQRPILLVVIGNSCFFLAGKSVNID